jgi:uncharacterized membrane protein YfcA
LNLGIYLPVAGTSVNMFLLFGLGGVVGFLSGLFGVGGGFLLTPLLIIIGIPPTVAAASDSNQIVAASASGTYAHARGGTVDFKMGILLLIGGVIGGTLGVRLIQLLRSIGEANFVISVTYVVMLGSIGSYMFYDSLLGLFGKTLEKTSRGTHSKATIYARLLNTLPFKMEFTRSHVTFSAIIPLFLGGLVGILAAIMGVGGGFIMVPIMIYILRMPMHVVVGTSLFQILFTCINVTIMQAWMNHSVDFILALNLLFGSVIGAQIGTQAGKRLKTDQLKILLSLIVMVVMIKMLVDLLSAPEILLSYKGRH